MKTMKNPTTINITLDLYDYSTNKPVTYDDIADLFDYNHGIITTPSTSHLVDVCNDDGEILMTLDAFTCRYFKKLYYC
jgi:hypothetical protein